MGTPLNAKGSAPSNLAARLDAVRERRRLARRRLYRKSKLDRYRAELVRLRRMGASYPELALYVWHTHRKRVNQTTVRRYLIKLPEMEEEADHADLPKAR